VTNNRNKYSVINYLSVVFVWLWRLSREWRGWGLAPSPVYHNKYSVINYRVKVYNRSGAGNQPFCNLIAISKDAIIDI